MPRLHAVQGDRKFESLLRGLFIHNDLANQMLAKPMRDRQSIYQLQKIAGPDIAFLLANNMQVLIRMNQYPYDSAFYS